MFRSVRLCGPRLAGLVAAVSLVGLLAGMAAAGNFRNSAVGGVVVNAEGVLAGAELDQLGELRQLRQSLLQQTDSDLQQPSKLRKISLRRLEEAISQRRSKVQMPLVTDDMQYLAGLTRIQYVFVYPEENDIVLAGPAEGWTVDARGNVVGSVSGQPVLNLDHLLVALRTAESAARDPITCSIDPTEEGIRRLQAFMKTQSQFGPATLRGVEQALGLQTIKITGVAPTSGFARTMVAADYRMKRLAMGFERAPLPGMPSYLQMISSGSAVPQNMFPRWWLAPNYEAMLKDPGGLAWQLRGPGVKVLTEDSLFAADGGRQQSGKASPAAQKWAETMTANYEQLALKEPVFGELRNLMDMAVASALLVKENLLEKAGCRLDLLMDPRELLPEEFDAPRQVASQASALKKGRTWVISASGGVDLASWAVADKVETSADLAPLHGQARAAAGDRWWWD